MNGGIMFGSRMGVWATMAMIAGAAVAQPPAPPPAPASPPAREVEGRTLRGHPDQPLGQAPRESASGSSSVTMMQNDGTNSTKVVIRDGEVVEAELNGKAVPKDRIRQRDGTVEFLDEKGNVEHTMKMNLGFTTRGFGGGNWNQRNRGGDGFRVERDGQRPLAVLGPRYEPPKVMLGVTMSDADDVTLKRLGLEDKEGIFIDTVIDGLPAAKAGLQPNDLIVAINGEKDPSQEELRKVLREKKPGETINLKIHRKGESKDLSVTLEAYEPGKLGHDAFGGGPAEGGQGMLWVPGEERDWDQFPGQVWDFGMDFDKDEVRDAINEALESLREEAGDLGKVKEEASRELQRALAELDKHKDQLKDLANLYRDRAGGIAPRIRFFNDRGVLPPDAPPAAAPVPAVGSSTLDRIAEQLDRLNSRLDALEKRLDEKK